LIAEILLYDRSITMAIQGIGNSEEEQGYPFPDNIIKPLPEDPIEVEFPKPGDPGYPKFPEEELPDPEEEM
jgi:hypothetical protein